MTDTFDGMPAPSPSAAHRGNGAVGDRQLIAVQTFDIARLTTHPVPLVPGTFVAVTGEGPKGDSNGSGKTSFLAAVSLLHAEAQWRLETDGGRHAAGLLFRPAAAGVADASYRPADHGYVVGVFADPASPGEGQITVWMRISVSTPYVLVRHTEGLHVAHGDSDQRRYEQADTLWDALDRPPRPGTRTTTFGAKKLTTELYGEAPRCMAYLDTTLRPGAPSLLSQQMTEMTPERIGESLIALTGREGLLDHELEQRRSHAEQSLSLADREDQDARTRVEEQAELWAVAERDRARAALADGEHLWRLHFARGYLEASHEDQRLVRVLEEALGAVERAAESVERATAQWRELAERQDLTRAEAVAEAEVARLDSRRAELEGQLAVTSNDLHRLTLERRRLLAQEDGWDGTSVEDARRRTATAEGALEEARLALRDAERRHRACESALRQAEEGTGGPAGPALAVLAEVGVTAAPLLDHVQVGDEARPRWEPRLWPHREAVVVAPRDAAAAVSALAPLPGACVVVADGALDAGGVEHDGASSSLPLGRFLNGLTTRTQHATEPERAVDTTLAETTLGGFPVAIAGRAARVRAAQDAVHESAALLQVALRDERGAARRTEEAAAQLTAASAAAALEELGRQEERLQQAQVDVTDALTVLRPQLRTARDAHLEAAATARNHAGRVELAASAVRLSEGELEQCRVRLRGVREERERLALEYWQRGWGGSPAEARALLDDQPHTLSTGRADSLRRRAAEALKEALDVFLRGVPPADVPPDLAEASRRRQQLADGGVGGDTVDFGTVARPLRDQLDGLAERDEVQSDRIHREQARRADEISALREEVARLDADLVIVQDMVAGSIDAALGAISARLDRLNRRRGGFGAELRVAYERPDGPAAPWRWKVTPRWRRSPGGPMVSFKEVANGAQVKVFAIQLVLAALLAAEGGSGRVLVLDELGNSLGDENRKDVLADLDDVARDQNVTILGACQNSVLEDAAARCGQILWFSHATATDAFNKPTRAWGFDADGHRVDAVAPWLREGRTLA